MEAKVSLKLSKVRRRGYVRVGDANNLTHYFLVPKGEDIRMIYNGTSRGLNNSLFDTHFALHTDGYNLCLVGKGIFMANWVIGEILLNFVISEEVTPYCGVDVMHVRAEE